MKAQSEKNLPYIVHQYVATILIFVISFILWLFSGKTPIVGGVALAAGYFFSSAYWIREAERARKQKCLLDEQLIQSQKLASIGELSAGIAHEINNPIAIIGQESEWLRHLLNDDPKNMEEINDSLREIARQVERCKEITQKLLSFARKMEPVFQAVDINKLVDDMAKLVEKEAGLHNIRVIRDFHPNLPKIYTDPPLIRQVVLNLLNNATHAIGKDGVITIETCLSKDNCVNVIVRDTGCGIPRENLGKIFDPFFTTKPPGKGTGLGLSICHGIVENLGGRISVSSEVGKGTTFSLVLPASK
jgi:two-component system NtrC family sensor kinase